MLDGLTKTNLAHLVLTAPNITVRNQTANSRATTSSEAFVIIGDG